MPKQTFFNLPVEKQTRLLEAAHHEFSRRGFNEASINQIIKEAGVSRGSFYQYFEDKHDLYQYFARKLGENLEAAQKAILPLASQDLFSYYQKSFTLMLEDFYLGENREFYRTMIANRDYRLLSKDEHHQNIEKRLQEVYDSLSEEKYRFESYGDFRLFNIILEGAVFRIIGGKLSHDEVTVEKINQIEAQITKVLTWFQDGVLKTERK